MGRPSLCSIPREHQSFPLAPAFPPAVAGMWWPREQCRHLALVTSATAREQLPGTTLLPRSRQEADGDDTGRHFLQQDVRAFSTTLPLLAQQGLGHSGIAARGCQSRVPHTGTSTLLHPARPSAISIPLGHIAPPTVGWALGCSARTSGVHQELNQQEPVARDPLPLSPPVPSTLLKWLGESPALSCPQSEPGAPGRAP